MIAAGFVIAVAGLRAVGAPETLRAPIRADRTRPARRAVACASHGIAGSTVLTTTLRFAFLAMLAHRTQIVA